jgi:hypothetical protein
MRPYRIGSRADGATILGPLTVRIVGISETRLDAGLDFRVVGQVR